jgi:hypothetical protein
MYVQFICQERSGTGTVEYSVRGRSYSVNTLVLEIKLSTKEKGPYGPFLKDSEVNSNRY